MKKILISALVLLIIAALIVGYIFKQEFSYRKLVKEVFLEVATTYKEIGALVKEKETEKVNTKCSDLINKHNEWSEKISTVNVPSKHTESYVYMKESIIDLSSGIIKICDGLKSGSNETLFQGLEATKAAEGKMLKGKDIFLEE